MIHIGCGRTPVPGWYNIDSSPSVTLAKHPLLVSILKRLGLLSLPQLEFIEFCKTSIPIRRGDATKHIEERDGEATAVYACHVLEHLDQAGAAGFLKEVYRVMAPGGILRLAVPDLRRHAETYLKTGDADAFVEATLMATPKPSGLRAMLREILSGHRHRWMYDGESLSRLLVQHGFAEPVILACGETTLPPRHGLNLYERSEDSVYVEATKP